MASLREHRLTPLTHLLEHGSRPYGSLLFHLGQPLFRRFELPRHPSMGETATAKSWQVDSDLGTSTESTHRYPMEFAHELSVLCTDEHVSQPLLDYPFFPVPSLLAPLPEGPASPNPYLIPRNLVSSLANQIAKMPEKISTCTRALVLVTTLRSKLRYSSRLVGRRVVEANESNKSILCWTFTAGLTSPVADV